MDGRGAEIAAAGEGVVTLLDERTSAARDALQAASAELAALFDERDGVLRQALAEATRDALLMK